MSKNHNCVAFIPSRAGSKRIKNKNIQLLQNHPMIAYSISSALQSGVFQDVVVATDSPVIAEISEYYGAQVPFLRSAEISADQSPDIEWVEFFLKKLSEAGKSYDAFSILRPTSPFRQASTIDRAWSQFQSHPEADSLRAVEKCKQHPGKMWIIKGNFIEPLMGTGPNTVPWHSTPYQALPPVYAQNASLEIAWTKLISTGKGIAGDKVIPFFTEGTEGWDINEPKDLWYAQQMVASGEATLPAISKKPFPMEAALS